MVEGTPYQPEEHDILAHTFDARHPDAYFSVGTNYGVGQPHYYVCLDENGGERSWWLDPGEAERLGRKLLQLGEECGLLNSEEERRRVRAIEDDHERDAAGGTSYDG